MPLFRTDFDVACDLVLPDVTGRSHLTARHAACGFNGASVAPGYVVADSTDASAQENCALALWLRSALSLLARRRFATARFMLRIKPLRLAGGYRVA